MVEPLENGNLQPQAKPRRHVTHGKNFPAFCVVAVIIVVLDRVTKVWAAANIPSEGLDFIPGFIGFKLVFNRGASFGIMQGAQTIFIIISAIICIIILVYMLKRKAHPGIEAVSLALVFAGAIGNAYDRLFYGQVTDFLNFEFFDFPVFNVADSAITIGVIIWIVFLLFHPMSPFAGDSEKDDEARKGRKTGKHEKTSEEA